MRSHPAWLRCWCPANGTSSGQASPAWKTPLFAALSLAVLRMGLQQTTLNLRHWGVLLTLLVLTRPEGLLLGALILVWRFFRPSAPEGLVERLRPVIPLVVALLALGALNLALSGQPLPSTLVAKNAAYAFGFDLAGYGRFIAEATLELSRGPLLLLIPGILYTIWRRLPGGHSDGWLPLLWVVGLMGAYAVWLPAVYHHGRYLMPLMPLLLIYGVQGSRALLQARPYPLLAGVAPWIMAALVALSWLRGADIYRENVAFIQKQQVTLARWISQNTPEDARIASHDIGALGYFSQRPIIDMAGLAHPGTHQQPQRRRAHPGCASGAGCHVSAGAAELVPTPLRAPPSRA